MKFNINLKIFAPAFIFVCSLINIQAQSNIVVTNSPDANANGTYVPTGTSGSSGKTYWKHESNEYYIHHDEFAEQDFWNLDNGDRNDENGTVVYSDPVADEQPWEIADWWDGSTDMKNTSVSFAEEVSCAEIEITGNGNEITSGDVTSSIIDHTEFVYAKVAGGSSTRTYTIHNRGGANLTVGSITFSGTHSGDFSVTSLPISDISGNSSSSFTVTFSPSGEGDRMATISVVNDDSDESPYRFAIMGEGFVEENLNVSGISSPSDANGTYEFQGYLNGYGHYLNGSGYNIYHASGFWFIDDNTESSAALFDKSNNKASPKGLTEWSELSGSGTPSISKAVPSPEIKLAGNSANIVSGDATPSFEDNTHFGSLDVSTGIRSRIFTIENTGDATLTLSGESPYVAIGGSASADYTVTTPPSSSISAGSSTTFTIEFDASAQGDREATISITSDDDDESTYSFDIVGSGFAPANLELGDVTNPSEANGLYLHQGILNEFQYWKHETLEFYIYNDDESGRHWNIDRNTVDDDGGNGNFADDDFLFIKQSTAVSPVDITAWSVNTAIGHETSGTPVFGSREIYVEGNSQVITDGDATPSSFDHTDFGSVNAALGSVSRTFTIGNSGDLDLSLTGASPYVTISGDDAADFAVEVAPTATISGDNSTTFIIKFDPSAYGVRSASISIANDDPDENPYNFNIQGFGVNSTPVATAPSAPTVNEDENNVAISDVIDISDSDGNSQTVTFSITGGTLNIGTSGISFAGGGNGSASFTAQGSLAAINAALDDATYTPTPGLNGTNAGVIAFTSNDGVEDSNSASVTFTILAVNDDPEIVDLPTDVYVTEDVASDINLSDCTFSDVDAGSNNVVLTIAAGVGTLSANDGGSVTIGNSGTGAITLSGTANNIDTYLNVASNIKYTSSLNSYGNDATTLTLTANDGGNSGSGGAGDVSLGTINVHISAVNDAPQLNAVATNLRVYKGSSLILSMDDVIASDVDNIDSDLSLVVSSGNNYTVSGLEITPDADFVGILTVPVAVSDGEETSLTMDMSITVDVPTVLDNVKANFLKVFPNPTTSIFSVTGVKGIARLYDLAGREVLSHNLNQGKEINISHLPNGIYVLRVKGEDIKIFKK